MYRATPRLALGIFLLCMPLLVLLAPLHAAPLTNTFTTGEGIANPLLQGWIPEVVNGTVGGIYSDRLVAPLCAQVNTPGCRSDQNATPHVVGMSVQRSVNESVRPADRLPALLLQMGYQAETQDLHGYTVQRLTPSTDDAPFAVVYSLVIEAVEYTITFSPSFRSDPDLVNQIMAGFVFTPAEAPAAFVLADPQPPPTDPGAALPYRVYLPLVASGNAAPATSSPKVTLTQSTPSVATLTLAAPGAALMSQRTPSLSFSVSDFPRFEFDRLDDLAKTYGGQGGNPYNFEYRINGILYANGALFIDCMLRATGYEPALCGELPDGSTVNGNASEFNSYIGMPSLYPMLLNSGAVQIAESAAQPGDIFILAQPGYCWGGIVVEHSDKVYVATQSANYASVAANSLTCGNNNPLNRSYLRLDSFAPSATFLAPSDDVALKMVPGDQVFSYVATESTDGPQSGVRGVTLAAVIDGQLQRWRDRDPATSYTADLDLPCRQIDLMALAYDMVENADLGKADYLAGWLLIRGDADGDGQISEADYAAIRAADGLSRTDAGYAPGLDPTGDGMIDAADRLFVDNLLLHTCPQP
ncbi:hypothetical protein [Candidatus Oscillochloris fontis]|uniref:hypothetical protein n=1 Tax=Candidatus Oscillochloris fontis TaxID=2496868 RepID=UPI00101D1D47|nr:hypothetical protein [Candidatus Oscillochloris fontis]